MISCARATRGFRKPSLDARIRGSPRLPCGSRTWERPWAQIGATRLDFTATPRDYSWIGTETDSRNLLIVDEQRYIDIGSSDKGDVLVVANTERSSNIRTVSCRKATSSERKLYEEDNGYNRTSGPTLYIR